MKFVSDTTPNEPTVKVSLKTYDNGILEVQVHRLDQKEIPGYVLVRFRPEGTVEFPAKVPGNIGLEIKKGSSFISEINDDIVPAKSVKSVKSLPEV